MPGDRRALSLLPLLPDREWIRGAVPPTSTLPPPSGRSAEETRGALGRSWMTGPLQCIRMNRMGQIQLGNTE